VGQLDYDGQRKRTKVKSKALVPKWNEKVPSAPHVTCLCVEGGECSPL
jgi:hypothetical protein